MEQVVKLADQVHYIYRHDGAMVLLKQETLKDWETASAEQGPAVQPPANILARLFSGERDRLKTILAPKTEPIVRQ